MEVDSELSAEAFRKQNLKLRKLGRVIRDLLADDPPNTQRALEARGIEDLDAFLSSSEAPDLEAFWDNDDGLYRCPECAWELEHGECRQCGLEFNIDIRDEGDYTRNETHNPDRLPALRGDTPLRDDDQLSLPPSSYTSMSGQIEYAELRRRGATRLMCETFNLEFNAATGIFAWADGDIYREFAGPLMQVGDFWKIMLGRRIQLDEDDPDGSLFIEAVLEDALLFPPVDAVLPAVSVSGSASGSSESSDSDSDTWGAKEVDNRLEPGYVAPSLPVQNQNYETSDAESDGDMDIDMTMDDPSVKGEENEDRPIEEAAEGDDDPGWTWDPSIPDTCWLPGNEASDEDSADSDFDSNDSC